MFPTVFVLFWGEDVTAYSYDTPVIMWGTTANFAK